MAVDGCADRFLADNKALANSVAKQLSAALAEEDVEGCDCGGGCGGCGGGGGSGRLLLDGDCIIGKTIFSSDPTLGNPRYHMVSSSSPPPRICMFLEDWTAQGNNTLIHSCRGVYSWQQHMHWVHHSLTHHNTQTYPVCSSRGQSHIFFSSFDFKWRETHVVSNCDGISVVNDFETVSNVWNSSVKNSDSVVCRIFIDPHEWRWMVNVSNKTFGCRNIWFSWSWR